MDLDLLFRALSDPTRRRLIDELAERDGQTLFELHVRLITSHGASLSRQALSKHLHILEEAGLLRTEWQWRSKHHFLDRAPIRQAWTLWLGNHAGRDGRDPSNPIEITGETTDEDRADQRAGR
jgi:DNA-binding transcriptional ArsR family regulator